MSAGRPEVWMARRRRGKHPKGCFFHGKTASILTDAIIGLICYTDCSMKPLSLARPHLIVVVGIPGSGKTTFAEQFAKEFGVPFVNPSYIEQHMLGVRYESNNSEARAIAIGDKLLKEFLKTGQTIIYEDITGSREFRKTMIKVARSAGYKPFFIWVQTDSAEASRRSARSTKEVEGMEASRFDEIVERFTVPATNEKAVVISGRHTFASQIRGVIKRLMDDPYAPKPIPEPTITVRRAPPLRMPIAQSTASRSIDFSPVAPMIEFEDERKPRRRRTTGQPKVSVKKKKASEATIVKDKANHRTTISFD